MSIFSDMAEWSKRPFRPDMSVTGWLLFIGLIIVAVIAWQQVVRFIVD